MDGQLKFPFFSLQIVTNWTAIFNLFILPGDYGKYSSNNLHISFKSKEEREK